MATIKHLCGIRVKLVRTTEGKQCEGCIFDKGEGNHCKPFWECWDVLSCDRKAFNNPNIVCHWERAPK